MKQNNRFSTIEIVVIVMLLCIVCIVGSVYFSWTQHLPFESMAELENVRAALPNAEARWKAAGVIDYDIDAYAFSHPGGCWDFSKKDFSTPLPLKIRQGQIIYASEQHKQWASNCDFESFLPPKVFDLMRKVLARSNPMNFYMSAKFDPKYGFLVSYHLTNNGPYPNPRINYSFSNFRPVP